MPEPVKHGAFDRGTAFWPSMFEPLRQFGSNVAHFFSPTADASHDTDNYRITVELPGVGQDDIDLSIHDGVLTVKGEKNYERHEEDKDAKYFFSERVYGSFQRSFRLPADADTDRIDAKFRDGVLTILIPRQTEPAASGKKIPVTKG